MNAIRILLRSFTLRCPNCGRSRMPRNPYAFHRQCAHCGLVYQADEGDFWGGMVFSYTFAGIIGLVVAGILNAWGTFGWETIVYVSALSGLASVLVLFPFAKSMWIYVLFHTRGQYEEFRPKGDLHDGR